MTTNSKIYTLHSFPLLWHTICGGIQSHEVANSGDPDTELHNSWLSACDARFHEHWVRDLILDPISQPDILSVRDGTNTCMTSELLTYTCSDLRLAHAMPVAPCTILVARLRTSVTLIVEASPGLSSSSSRGTC